MVQTVDLFMVTKCSEPPVEQAPAEKYLNALNSIPMGLRKAKPFILKSEIPPKEIWV